MRFGLNPCYSWPVGGDPHEQVHGIIDQARVAIGHDYDSLWFPHSYLNSQYNRYQPVPILARLMGIAEDIDIGIVQIVTLDHPIVVAENLATLSHLTNGTLTLTAIQGYVPSHFDAFDVPKSQRVGRFVEAIELLRKLWAEADVTYDGTYYSVQEATVNPKADIPIYIGANAGRAVERAGNLGDGWVISERTSINRGSTLLSRYQEGLDQSPRQTPWIAMIRPTYVAETTEQAREEIRPMVKGWIKTFLDRGAHEIVDELDDIESQAERMMEGYIIGSPDECVERVRRIERKLGVDEIICIYGWRDFPNEKMMRSISLFGKHVIPSISD